MELFSESMKDLTNKENYLEFTVTLNHPNECHPSWESHPLLLKEIDLDKNTELTYKNKRIHALELSVGTNKKLDWKCSTCEHEWRAKGSERVQGTGCPCCANKVIHIDGRNSIAMTHPELVNDFQGNATKVITGKCKKHEWKCSVCGHKLKVSARVYLSKGCPICNSLGNLYPRLVNEWHPQNIKSPYDYLPQSNIKVKWLCSQEHEWDSVISNRSVLKRGCPYCTNQAVCKENCLQTISPLIAAEWHPTLNGELTPRDVVAKSAKKVWWKCPNGDDHEWFIQPGKRLGVDKTGCPYCDNQKVSTSNRLDIIHPIIAKEWNQRRNNKMASEYVFGSNHSVWWECSTCQHEWNTSIINRTKNKSGCSSCVGMVVNSKGGSSIADIAFTVASEWHPTKNGKKRAVDYRPGSGIPIWWECSTCQHEWESKPNTRLDSMGNSKSGCPACTNKTIHIDGRNSMAITNPELAKEFQGDATTIVAGTGDKLDWRCSICRHEWVTSGSKRKNGRGCPACATTGFQPHLPGYYYVNEILNEMEDRLFFKCGISGDWEQRLRELSSGLPNGLSIRNIEVIYFEIGQEARNLEAKLLQISDIRAPKRDFEGGNELFMVNPLEYIRTNNDIEFMS